MTHINLLRNRGWEGAAEEGSGREGHRSVAIPTNASWLWKLIAFSGPGYLVAVGYMDPGNWATDLVGGSFFGYTLLSVVLLSSLSAMMLQYLSAKLGIATGRDLAEVCREALPWGASIFLWLMAEVMIIACDLAEVIGTAVALQLLFHIPIAIGVLIAAADVFLLLWLQRRGLRFLEALIMVLVGTIALCLGIDLFFAHPAWGSLALGFVPSGDLFPARGMAAAVAGFFNFGAAPATLLPSPEIVGNSSMLYVAIGIIGATVMPHNLYLHSALSQTRRYAETPEGKREAILYSGIDSGIALTLAFAVNAAILVLSAAAFHSRGIAVDDISKAYELLAPVLGATFASILFAVALLASGQNSTVTGTMAGQIVMEGFLSLHMSPWLRRLITRGLAIVPALIFIWIMGSSHITKLLVLSQVVLSIQLPFAMIPLVVFTSSRRRMGEFVNSLPVIIIASFIAAIITALNVWLVWSILA